MRNLQVAIRRIHQAPCQSVVAAPQSAIEPELGMESHDVIDPDRSRLATKFGQYEGAIRNLIDPSAPNLEPLKQHQLRIYGDGPAAGIMRMHPQTDQGSLHVVDVGNARQLEPEI